MKNIYLYMNDECVGCELWVVAI